MKTEKTESLQVIARKSEKLALLNSLRTLGWSDADNYMLDADVCLDVKHGSNHDVNVVLALRIDYVNPTESVLEIFFFGKDGEILGDFIISDCMPLILALLIEGRTWLSLVQETIHRTMIALDNMDMVFAALPHAKCFAGSGIQREIH